jgi:hypothetical protein
MQLPEKGTWKMKLIARWNGRNRNMNRLPDEVLWENGRRASLDDYRRHLDCTSRMVDTVPGCMEQHFEPDIVADVRYDHFAGQWAISGDGVEPTGLQLTDPNAPDEQIIAELFTFPVVYRARIHR